MSFLSFDHTTRVSSRRDRPEYESDQDEMISHTLEDGQSSTHPKNKDMSNRLQNRIHFLPPGPGLNFHAQLHRLTLFGQ